MGLENKRVPVENQAVQPPVESENQLPFPTEQQLNDMINERLAQSQRDFEAAGAELTQRLQKTIQNMSNRRTGP